MASVPIARHAFAHKADSQDKKRRSALHPLALRGEPLDAKRGKRTRACPGPTKEYGRWRMSGMTDQADSALQDRRRFGYIPPAFRSG